MRKYIAFTAIFAVLIMAFAIPSFSKTRTIDKLDFPELSGFKLPEVEKVELKNGITLYILEDHELPLVRINARLAAGNYLDPADKIGLADICGTVMRTGGTEAMTGDEVDIALESIGASISVNFGTTSGTASLNILSDYSDTGLELLADIMRSPRFEEDKIEIEKSAQRTAISSRNDEPLGIAFREYKKTIYGAKSPYARHTEYSTIENITRQDLIDFHKNFITPENVMMAIWGDFDKDEMIGKIEEYFGDWATGSGEAPPLPEVNYDFVNKVHYIEKNNVTQSTVLMGHIGGKVTDPDYYAMTVANNVLSGTTLGGRMFNEVRSKKGLAYSTGGNFTSNIEYPGIFYSYVITKLESTVEAAEAVRNEIRRMQTDAPTEDELQRAKEGYLNSFVFKFDSKGEILNRMMTYDYYGLPQDFIFKVKEGIEKVTAEDVMDVAQRRFHPDSLHMIILGLEDAFDQSLTALGPVDTLDITIPSGEIQEDIVINEETLAQGMELFKKALEASGGKEGFAKIKSGKSTSAGVFYLPQFEMSIEAKSLFVFPNKSKEIMTSPMMPGEIIIVSTGDKGWRSQMGQVEDMSSEELMAQKKDRFRNLLLLFKNIDNPEYQVVFVESTELEGRKVDILKVIHKQEDMSFKLALDAESHLPAAKMYFGETPAGPGNITQIISDYRDVSGVKIPFSITLKSGNEKVADINVTEYTINAEIPDQAFVKP